MEFSSLNPATGEIVWRGAAASVTEVDLAVQRARSAFAEWSQRPSDQRIAVLRSYAAALEQRKPALAEIISREVGKPMWESLAEVQSMVAKIETSIDAHAKRCGDFRGGAAITRFRPHGVVAVLGPFNFPGHLPNGHIVPALLAGNTVVYKPSEYAPATAEIMASAWRDAGLPSGALNLVQGLQATGAALAEHGKIDGLFFTGSARTGLALAKLFASAPQKILALEMGGNNPLVIWDVREVRAAALITVQSAYASAGQRCTCARRLIVPNDARGDRLIDEILSLARALTVGPFTLRPEPFMGPVINAAAAERLLEAQTDLTSRGATTLLPMRLLTRGTGLLSPGLLDVTAVRDREDTEHFGPLLQVIRVPTFEAALAEANATRYGLAAGLLSDEPANYDRFLREVRAGVINWNQPLTGASSGAAFGGVGQSGNHRPSAYLAADYCSYPVASIEYGELRWPDRLPPGLEALGQAEVVTGLVEPGERDQAPAATKT